MRKYLFLVFTFMLLLVPIQVFAASDAPNEVPYEVLESFGIAGAELTDLAVDGIYGEYLYVLDGQEYIIDLDDTAYTMQGTDYSYPREYTESLQGEGWEDTYDYTQDTIAYESEEELLSQSIPTPVEELVEKILNPKTIISFAITMVVVIILGMLPWVKICRNMGMGWGWMLVPLVGWIMLMRRTIPEDAPKRGGIIYCPIITLLIPALSAVAGVVVNIPKVGVILSVILLIVSVIMYIIYLVKTGKGYRWIDAAVKCVDYKQASFGIALLAILLPPVWWLYAMLKY